MTIVITIGLIILGYLMGSICSAVIVCHLFNLPDPREEGSQNPGATNVLRIAGKQYAALVMLVDMLKGTIPVALGHALLAPYPVVAVIALATVVGHIYPVFFDFRGGKGVATAIGALLGLNFIVGVLVIATWLLVANFLRYSSLASLIAITFSPLYTLLIIQNVAVFPPLLIIVILIIFKHKENITRLLDGVEPKIKFKHSVIEEIMDSSPAKNVSANEEISEFQDKPVKKNKNIQSAKTQAQATETIKHTAKLKSTKVTKPKTKKTHEEIKPVKKSTPTKPKKPQK